MPYFQHSTLCHTVLLFYWLFSFTTQHFDSQSLSHDEETTVADVVHLSQNLFLIFTYFEHSFSFCTEALRRWHHDVYNISPRHFVSLDAIDVFFSSDNIWHRSTSRLHLTKKEQKPFLLHKTHTRRCSEETLENRKRPPWNCIH